MYSTLEPINFLRPFRQVHLNVHIEFDPGMVWRGVLVCHMTSLRKWSILKFVFLKCCAACCFVDSSTFSPGQIVDDTLKYSLLRMAKEVAEGMEYLASRSFIHRVREIPSL